MEAETGLVRRGIVNVPFLSEVDHAEDDLAVLRLPEVDVLSNLIGSV